MLADTDADSEPTLTALWLVSLMGKLVYPSAVPSCISVLPITITPSTSPLTA
jgi:hypothetical protein